MTWLLLQVADVTKLLLRITNSHLKNPKTSNSHCIPFLFAMFVNASNVSDQIKETLGYVVQNELVVCLRDLPSRSIQGNRGVRVSKWVIKGKQIELAFKAKYRIKIKTKS